MKTTAAKIITKTFFFSKIMFRGNSFCNYYRNTLHLARKDHKKITKIVVSGNYFVIISARMVYGNKYIAHVTFKRILVF